MHDKDIVSKRLLKQMTQGLARLLLGLELTDVEILETQHQRIEERRADLVAKVKEHGNSYILHIEIQNHNQSTMPTRMLRYLTDIVLAHPGLDVKQYVIYIGRAKLGMAAGMELTGLSYCYRILDMHKLDCESLLRQDKPEALVFAILCDFGPQSSRQIVKRILQGLQDLTGGNEAAFRDYLLMLEILSSNRDLKQIVQEEENMLSQVKYSDLPSFGLGMQQGLEQGREEGREEGREQGKQQGEALMLQKLLQLKFGDVPVVIQQRLQTANTQDLLYWSERILSAKTLTEIFAEH
jgi:predicted transposase YdaD